MTIPLQLHPIGFVHSDVSERSDTDWGNTIACIKLLSQYSGALTGLDSFSHALILTYLHQAHYEQEKHRLRRPRNRQDMPKLGIFAQRAKNRPNPIGVTAVEIIKVTDDQLHVKGLDAIDETPVLDIKPYFPEFDQIASPRVPDWVERLMAGYF